MAAGLADKIPVGDSRLARRLAGAIEGDVLFDRFSRGRYATDASIYQIEPIGVVVPRHVEDLRAVLAIAGEAGAPILPRGGGTSQCGQTVGRAIVLDMPKYFTGIKAFDPEAQRITVEPGLVLDRLNHALKDSGLMFPVDISTASRATIGGMTANNSCGARSIRYGNMIHNVHAVNALLGDGGAVSFGPVPETIPDDLGPRRYRELVAAMRGLAAREAEEIEARFPKLLRRVGGYNIDSVKARGHNMADLLVGSEGTLGLFTEITLDLVPIPPHAALGVCHFPSLSAAMKATKAIVALTPDTVELADRTLINLARAVPLYRDTVDAFVTGDPAALLLVEFSGDDADGPKRRLARLVELMADLGHPGAVVEATEPAFRKAIWEVRKAGLNIMMSMKGDGKPVSFIEDCAVSLDDLPAYTDRLTRLFERHGTTGTWYAHASVGCLHVRPILNMKRPDGARTMRAIAEEAFTIVRDYKGSHSGEHGDGLVRSEFHHAMFGPRVTAAFAAVKSAFDPAGIFNPGKIVDPERMDDRRLFRYPPGYAAAPFDSALDWSSWGGFLGAVEMCNNNGACRKAGGGVMCPSFRASGDEQQLTRGRANSLRLAMTGQLGQSGPDALASDAMAETMATCLACKGCKRECPTGVDMARMKIEVARHRAERHGVSLRDRVVGHLPVYGSLASRHGAVLNRMESHPFWRRLRGRALGFSAGRRLPRWHGRPLETPAPPPDFNGDAILFADCFSRWFEPEAGRAAERVLDRLGFRTAWAGTSERPLCCGRSYLSVGLVDEARREARRLHDALSGLAGRGVAIIGFEPACLLTLRDEIPALLPGQASEHIAGRSVLFTEFLACRRERLSDRAGDDPPGREGIIVHGHCHEKAFGLTDGKLDLLSAVTGRPVTMIESGCCGMAGAFGYEAEHDALSRRIGETDLAPAIRALPDTTLLLADGFSCRHQIHDLTGRTALHSAVWLDRRLQPSP